MTQKSKTLAAMATALADECSAQEIEQVRFIMAGSHGGRGLVVVCTSDVCVDAMLEYLDGLNATGRTGIVKEETP